MFSYNVDDAEILMYDVIGESWDGEGIHAGRVAEALQEMDGQRVTVRINSPGGIADEGIAIYNTLRRYKGGVDTVVDALAASAASIIALAGERRATLTGSRWMIHKAMGVGIGNSSELRKLAEILDVYDRSLADIYAAHMTGSPEAIMQQMGDETWFDATGALQAGLSNATLDAKSGQLPKMAAWFTKAPTDLLTQPAAKMRPQPVARELARLKLRLSEI